MVGIYKKGFATETLAGNGLGHLLFVPLPHNGEGVPRALAKLEKYTPEGKTT